MRQAPAQWYIIIGMMNKRLLTVQDLTTVGKCSIGVALPVVSAMGVECCALPTSLLSTHTAFPNFARTDLLGEVAPFPQVWKDEGITFDCIHTGYLATVEQISAVEELIADFGGTGVKIVVDPVMGDFGRLYAGYSEDFPEEMRRLVGLADLILPNVTEAALLTGEDPAKERGPGEIGELAKKLASQCGAGTTVAVTGYFSDAEHIGAVACDAANGIVTAYLGEEVPLDFTLYGSGDLFSAVTAGALCLGADTDEALTLAVEFTARCIRATAEDEDRRWYGLSFERELPRLARLSAGLAKKPY